MCSITLSLFSTNAPVSPTQPYSCGVSREMEPAIYWNLLLNDRAMTFLMHTLHNHKFLQISFHISSVHSQPNYTSTASNLGPKDSVVSSSIITFFFQLSDGNLAFLVADRCFGSSKNGWCNLMWKMHTVWQHFQTVLFLSCHQFPILKRKGEKRSKHGEVSID